MLRKCLQRVAIPLTRYATKNKISYKEGIKRCAPYSCRREMRGRLQSLLSLETMQNMRNVVQDSLRVIRAYSLYSFSR